MYCSIKHLCFIHRSREPGVMKGEFITRFSLKTDKKRKLRITQAQPKQDRLVNTPGHDTITQEFMSSFYDIDVPPYFESSIKYASYFCWHSKRGAYFIEAPVLRQMQALPS